MFNAMSEFFAGIGRAVHIGTLVEYYDYIKAVEYLICVGFLIAFPLFYKHIIKYNGDSDKHKK